MTKRIPFTLALILTTATALHAQDNPNYERILVPVVANGVPGAHGSIWQTTLVGWNNSGSFIDVTDNPGSQCSFATCPAPPAQPYANFNFHLLGRPPRGAGVYLYVARPTNQKVSLHLRIHDLSRQEKTWGTEIPLIREGDVFTREVQLLNIPLDDRFRQTLRIYDFDGSADRRALVRVFGLSESSIPLVEREVILSRVKDGAVVPPGYVEFTNLFESFPAVAGEESVRIEIQPLTPGLRFWAFVSVTNNETQHVTLITPQDDPRTE